MSFAYVMVNAPAIFLGIYFACWLILVFQNAPAIFLVYVLHAG